MSPDFERLIAPDPVVEPREDDGGSPRTHLMQFVQGLEALGARQAEVEQRTIEICFAQCARRLGDVLDPGDVVVAAPALEQIPYQVGVTGVVLDQQDAQPRGLTHGP